MEYVVAEKRNVEPPIVEGQSEDVGLNKIINTWWMYIEAKQKSTKHDPVHPIASTRRGSHYIESTNK